MVVNKNKEELEKENTIMENRKQVQVKKSNEKQENRL